MSNTTQSPARKMLADLEAKTGYGKTQCIAALRISSYDPEAAERYLRLSGTGKLLVNSCAQPNLLQPSPVSIQPVKTKKQEAVELVQACLIAEFGWSFIAPRNQPCLTAIISDGTRRIFPLGHDSIGFVLANGWAERSLGFIPEFNRTPDGIRACCIDLDKMARMRLQEFISPARDRAVKYTVAPKQVCIDFTSLTKIALTAYRLPGNVGQNAVTLILTTAAGEERFNFDSQDEGMEAYSKITAVTNTRFAGKVEVVLPVLEPEGVTQPEAVKVKCFIYTIVVHKYASYVLFQVG